MAKMVKVNYLGKETEREEIVPGIVKYGEAYLIVCNETGAWKYCNEERYQKLVAKYGSPENLGREHCGREGKKIRHERESKAKAALKVKEEDAKKEEAPKPPPAAKAASKSKKKVKEPEVPAEK